MKNAKTDGAGRSLKVLEGGSETLLMQERRGVLGLTSLFVGAEESPNAVIGEPKDAG